MKTLVIQFIIISTVIFAIATCADAQDYYRFLKVKKWKINYELKIDENYVYPLQFLDDLENSLSQLRKEYSDFTGERLDDNSGPTAMLHRYFIELTRAFDRADAQTFSWNFEESYLKGDLVFDTKEGLETWIGRGKIDYSIIAISNGELMGSNAGGSILGNGSTSLCSNDSWFSIYPGSGTYELFLIPGDGDKAGINVELFSFNTVWEDVRKQIKDQMGKTSDEVLKNELKEIVEAAYEPENDDLFYCSDPDKWIVDVEGAKLPSSGLIIKGEKQIREGHTVSWIIEPAD